MVNYRCEICGKDFKKKSHWIDHTENKKKPCHINSDNKIILTEMNTNPQKKLTKPHNNLKNPQSIELIQEYNIIDDKFSCRFCGAFFCRKDNLKRHIDKYCKVKKLDKDKKEEIFNNLIEKEKKIELILKNYEDLEKQNKSLKKQITELEKNFKQQIKEQSKSYDNKIKQIITKNTNSNNTINSNNITNIIIPADKLVSFGKEDLKKIKYDSIIKSVGNWDITGYRIFTELLKLIHFNEKFPEFQNVYITDKNREKYMVWNGKNWILNDICLNQIIDKIQKLVVINEEDFEEAKKNKNFKDILTKLMKYINKYYDETEDGWVDHDFIDLVNRQLKEYLYNNRGIPKKNYLKLKDDITNKKTITNI